MDGMITDYLDPDLEIGALRGHGVLYMEDFDEKPSGEAGAEELPVIIAPAYTVEDVESAREEGRLSALEDHAAIQASLNQAALAAIADALAKSRQDAVAVAARQAQEIADTLLALLASCLPAASQRLAASEVAGLLDVLLPPLSREPGVELRVHPDVLPFIRETLAGMRDVSVHGDASLAASDLALSWRDGEARRDWRALWRGISASLPPFALPSDWHAEDIDALCAGDDHGR
jgi:hypothetical protein